MKDHRGLARVDLVKMSDPISIEDEARRLMPWTSYPLASSSSGQIGAILASDSRDQRAFQLILALVVCDVGMPGPLSRQAGARGRSVVRRPGGPFLCSASTIIAATSGMNYLACQTKTAAARSGFAGSTSGPSADQRRVAGHMLVPVKAPCHEYGFDDSERGRSCRWQLPGRLAREAASSVTSRQRFWRPNPIALDIKVSQL